MEYTATAAPAAAAAPAPPTGASKDSTSFAEDPDLRAKLAHQATSLLNQTDSGPKETRIPQPCVPPQPQIHPQLRAAGGAANSTEIMPSGLAAASTHPGAIPSASSAMAVHGLLDHDPDHDHDHDGDDSITDGRKAKRELSQSKRAAQNRAAQRAFRQRKEHHIKKLEQEVRDFRTMEETYKAVQNENYALREYVIQLQSRLMDSQIELPQPPPGLALHPPRPNAPRAVAPPHPPASVLEPAQATSSAGSLADVAAAVHAGISAREPPREMPVDGIYNNRVKPETSEERSDDEIRRQLQRDTLPPPSSLRA
ncbi:hypothetical protein PG996_010346 [Apiospora saccharicola]|uniref:Putative transcription factor kapC n=1 Tax=Apiospora saccharicola TaxID=335842 RepID=A0ABR1UNC6_9PEZI